MTLYLQFLIYAWLSFFSPPLLFSQESGSSAASSAESLKHKSPSSLLEELSPEELPFGWPSSEEKEADSFESKFFHMLTLLALLIAFMILASFALKRLMRSKISQLNGSGHIKLIEARSLSPRATLYLVEWGGKHFLLGETASSLNLIETASLDKEA